jgi:hypothetical protein
VESYKDLKYYLISFESYWVGCNAFVLYAENAPGRTWINLNKASKGLSIKCAKWYYTCWALWISTRCNVSFDIQSIF